MASSSTGLSDAARFALELEFVSCLANPRYVNHLAQSRVLAEPAMVAYLRYLQYWLRPEYAACVAYPAALGALQRLQCPAYRATLAAPDAAEHVWRQTFWHWQHGLAGLLAAQAPGWGSAPRATDAGDPGAAAAAAAAPPLVAGA